MAKMFLIVVSLAVVSAFGSSDERFIKKYAMMKIYESCFGPEVLKEIRREMKAACAKCAAISGERVPLPGPPQMHFPLRIPPVNFMDNRPTINKLGELDHGQNDIPMGPINLPVQPAIQEPPNVDIEKLQQAVMSFYAQQQAQQEHVPQLRPFGFNYQPYQANPYYPNVYPWMQQYQAPIGPHPYYFPAQIYRNRMSRDMDIRSRLEILTARSSGRVRNVTCVMQELGYLDQNLEPNYPKIAERIENLPVSNELKSDMVEGLQFCHKFSSCVPDMKRENSPLSKELIKPMFFFRCYKHKKLEACVMKDIREKFSNDEDLDTDADFRSLSRAGKSLKIDDTSTQTNIEELDDIAVSIYDFLYGSSDMDLDTIL